MASTILIAGTSLLLIFCFLQFRALRRNIAEAKQSGLPYVVAPVYFQTLWWMILGPSLSQVLQLLPKAWSERWLPLSLFGRVWHAGYGPFALLGDDTFIMVSTGGNVLWTCDPDAILQFSKPHHDFVKPVEMMGMLNLYGPTVTSTEGEESRLYRKTAAPSFNDRTHGSVWNESLGQTASLLNMWNSSKASITQLNDDVAKLTLHVISYVCFDRQMEWAEGSGRRETPSKSHKMSFREAISSMLDNIPILLLVPPSVLNLLPLAPLKKARTSYVEWKAYMEEIRDETKQSLQQNGSRNDASLLESLVEAGQTSSSDSKSSKISPDAVLGNIFVFILAGYETSANTLTYAITLLACRPELQRAIQSDIDRILGDRPYSQWTFESDFPKLLDGYIGAVMNETLRLYSVLPFLPKTTRETPKVLTLNGSDYTIPANTLILMNTSAAHRNPKFWPPAEPKAADGPPYPVSSFDPARWLRGESNKEKGTTTSSFSPTPGSFIPFAVGPRACIGKQFAQAEFCAVMAAIFKEYSVELATDDDVESTDGKEAQTFSTSSWEKAKRSAEKQLSDGVGFMMSLKMNGKVPLQLVRRESVRSS